MLWSQHPLDLTVCEQWFKAWLISCFRDCFFWHMRAKLRGEFSVSFSPANSVCHMLTEKLKNTEEDRMHRTGGVHCVQRSFAHPHYQLRTSQLCFKTDIPRHMKKTGPWQQRRAWSWEAELLEWTLVRLSCPSGDFKCFTALVIHLCTAFHKEN